MVIFRQFISPNISMRTQPHSKQGEKVQTRKETTQTAALISNIIDHSPTNAKTPPSEGLCIHLNRVPQLAESYWRSIVFQLLLAIYFALLLVAETDPLNANWRTTLYCILFIVGELLKNIFSIEDSVDPLNLKPFKKMLILLSNVLKVDMVYLLARLVYSLQSLPRLFMIAHFAFNAFRKTLMPGSGANGSSSSSHHSSPSSRSSTTTTTTKIKTTPNSSISTSPNSPASSVNSQTPTVNTTVTTSSFLFPVSLSPSRLLDLLNPLLLYCFCKTIMAETSANNQGLSYQQSDLSLLFLIFLLINLVIGSELRMILQGDRCWFLGRTTTFVTTETSVVNSNGSNGKDPSKSLSESSGSTQDRSSNSTHSYTTTTNITRKIITSYDRSKALKTMVMCGCVVLMAQNFLLMFESVQEEICLSIVHTLVLTATAQYLYSDSKKSCLD